MKCTTKKVAVGYFENATYTKNGKSTPVAYVASWSLELCTYLQDQL